MEGEKINLTLLNHQGTSGMLCNIFSFSTFVANKSPHKSMTKLRQLLIIFIEPLIVDINCNKCRVFQKQNRYTCHLLLIPTIILTYPIDFGHYKFSQPSPFFKPTIIICSKLGACAKTSNLIVTPILGQKLLNLCQHVIIIDIRTTFISTHT